MNLSGLKASLKRPAKQADARAAASSITLPPFLADLLRDMRDRRLVVPAIALVVAIVAVPVALGTSADPVPTATQFVPPPAAEAVQPAVLADQGTGIRDYRKRLDALKSKNPFKQPQAPSGPKAQAGSGTNSAAAVSTPAESNPPPPVTSVGANSPAASTGAAPTPTPPATPAPPSSNSSGSHEPATLLAPQVDIKIGPIGKTEEIDNVEPGDLLPARRTPVLIFIGARPDLSTASFLVSRDVAATKGDGRCSPSAVKCQVIRLADGDARTFDYGPEHLKYRIKLRAIRQVPAGSHHGSRG